MKKVIASHACILSINFSSSAREKSKGTGDVLWLKTVLSSGTLSDRVAALTLLIQESPVHTLAPLSSLISMASKKGKRESILAAGIGFGIGVALPTYYCKYIVFLLRPEIHLTFLKVTDSL